ncbi:sensor histidine kinase [Curtobacterium sp. MCBD17_003]|uniref:sensor histidine kinase n=1 Tax=Curtobacterium sp. MCBD17_003 TaxID=2175667 RepID=UPI000DA6DFC7|nr:sensor histidine kinase [Curtobacterium sp. MCBD17_003]WIE54081.1 sensor histidine kinase [Curtobacterium sp. MCBD17_003]
MTDATQTTQVRRTEDVRRTSRSFPWSGAPGMAEGDLRTARRRWYPGAFFGLAWQVLLVLAVFTDGGSVRKHVVDSVVLAVVYVAYLVAPELMWRRRLPGRIVVLSTFALLSVLPLVPLGAVAMWTWFLLASLVGFVAVRMWVAAVAILAIAAAQVVICGIAGWDVSSNDGLLFAPLVTVSIGASMTFFGRQRAAEQELGVAQDEITRLAVVEERARFSRDLHDVLGHSLTVVAIKSELAGRLVDRDPAAARAEMADVERLAREALQGLRQAVSGYREADLDAELVSARAALQAAGIDADLPTNADAVVADSRSLFAWVLREGVTNVVRHAAATRARVTLTRSAITVEDDGAGASDDLADGVAPVGAPLGGNGLRGLRERADAVGATMTTGTSDLGGFLLRVGRGRR